MQRFYVTEAADGLNHLRLQELEHEKLQVKLRNQLMERKREAKKAFDLAGQIQKRVQQAGGGEGRRPSARADEETYRVRRRWAAGQGQGLQHVCAARPSARVMLSTLVACLLRKANGKVLEETNWPASVISSALHVS